MMRTQAVIDGIDYTIHFEIDTQNDLSVEQVIRDRDGQDVWGTEWFIDDHADQVLDECKMFLSENLP